MKILNAINNTFCRVYKSYMQFKRDLATQKRENKVVAYQVLWGLK